jgi:hypothetical protein
MGLGSQCEASTARAHTEIRGREKRLGEMGNAPRAKQNATELKKSSDGGSDHAPAADQTLDRSPRRAPPLGSQARTAAAAIRTGGSPDGASEPMRDPGAEVGGLAPRSGDPARPRLGSLGLAPAAASIIAAARSPNRITLSSAMASGTGMAVGVGFGSSARFACSAARATRAVASRLEVIRAS